MDLEQGGGGRRQRGVGISGFGEGARKVYKELGLGLLRGQIAGQLLPVDSRKVGLGKSKFKRCR